LVGPQHFSSFTALCHGMSFGTGKKHSHGGKNTSGKIQIS